MGIIQHEGSTRARTRAAEPWIKCNDKWQKGERTDEGSQFDGMKE